MTAQKTRSRVPRLLQAVLVVVGIYLAFRVIFDVILGQPIPASLMVMYMFFVIAGVFMVFTFTEESARELVAPIKALVDDPGKKNIRNVVFIIVPLLVSAIVYYKMQPSLDAPLELRSIHPAPPASVKAFGKRFDLTKLENPYRKFEKQDPEKFRELVAEGGVVYIQNCQYCHGDKLDGNGPYAQGLNPVPLNFQDVGTIAQLQESFLFWRIATGGPGLPKEATPWISSMPVWQNFLSEEEIWKVILYLYDYTGRRPRSWEHE
ncbi:MAG: cytochrome c [Gammaproteobacteria bacterium]|jgi:mono/diheme cytochrome c family protein|nr:cytochrome c [Gammaproteobacteria bacterium]NCF83250.1 cytochrome c [Pseudomonadota bacterium]